MRLRSLLMLPMVALLVAVPTWAEDKKDDKDVTIVVAEGVGTTADDALKDAFRNAVRQVVGAVVDAETLVKNDEIISDKVLTYSGGFVKKYEEVSKKEEKGLFRIKIKASVERRSVVAKLKEAKVSVKDVDGQDLFSETVTKEEAKKNATELLTKALSGLPTLLTAEAVSKPEYDGTAKEVSLDVRVTVDQKAYAAYQEKLDDLLKKISLGQDSATLKGGPSPDTSNKPVPDLLVFTEANKKRPVFNGPKLEGKTADAWCIWLNTFHNESHTTTKWAGYIVDADLKKVMGTVRGNFVVTVSLLDSEQKLVTENEFKMPLDVGPTFASGDYPTSRNRNLPFLCHSVVRKNDGSGIASYDSRELMLDGKLPKKDRTVNLFICPYSFTVKERAGSECKFFYQPELVLNQRLKVSLEELKRIKKVECKLQFRPEEGSEKKKGK